VLFFAKEPQLFLKESHISCIRYEGVDRYSVLDRAEVVGDPINLIEESLRFVRRNTSAKQVVTGNARHQDLREYPMVAVRESIVNAVMHRDYYYDGSHTYLHLFSDRLEVENPGALPPGLRVEDLGTRSVRRNRTIADLLYRVKYVEQIGSGIQRMERALKENGNPPMEISVTSFFAVKFYPRTDFEGATTLTPRQGKLYRLIADRGTITSSQAAGLLGVSGDTALREINTLIHAGVVEKRGTGKSTTYVVHEKESRA
jgi:ATP-dependent DNA helicase RecG